jgi:FkbM family methyltransferase
MFRLAKPILRPLLVRWKSFLIDGLRQEVVAVAAHHGEMVAELTRHREDVGELLTGLAGELTRYREDVGELLAGLAGELTRQREDLGELLTRMTVAAQQAERVESYTAAAAQRVVIPIRDGNVLVRTNVGYVVCATDDEALLAILVDSGDLEKGTRLLLQRFLRPGDVFVDVGANLGLHSLAGARAMGGKGRVIAFEPFPPTVQLLERTVYLNGYSGLIEIMPAAVSKEGGTQSLHLGRTSGHHSLYPLAETLAQPPVEVSVVTLDELLGPTTEIDLIKIDVEGAELDVLDGARQLLQNNPGIALIVELGLSHLDRIGIGLSAWLDTFTSVGFSRWAIDSETGLLEQWSIDRLAEEPSVNLFFARDGSKAWSRLEL